MSEWATVGAVIAVVIVVAYVVVVVFGNHRGKGDA